MAHIVGVPKREPCQKCSLPVFLAERLTIGKKVYHRTCLKCARCNSQLSPGSFYETEIDGEYCCETCPDEEKANSLTSDSKDESLGRASIADRLAFFENDGKKVLQKSLSDEEKTQSLKKMTEDPQSVYKSNKALTSFMANHLADAIDSPSESISRRSSNSSTSSSISSSTSTESEEPPELPKSLPPSLEADISGISSKPSLEASLEPSVDSCNTGSQLESVNSSTIKENENHEKSPSQEEPATASNKIEQSNNAVEESYANTTTTIVTPDKNESNLSINVTKDNPEDDDKMSLRKNSISDSSKNTDIDLNSNGLQSTNHSSMVRARLHQFEVMSNKSQDSSISSVSKNRLSDLSKTRETINNESPISTEAEVPKHDSNDEEAHHDEKLNSSNDKLTNKEDEDASYHIPQEKVEENLVDVDKVIEPSHPQINENEKIDTFDNKNDSEPIDGTDYVAVEDAVDSLAKTDTKEEKDKSNQPSLEPVISSPSKSRPISDEYPEELNPFKSDDDEDDQLTTGSNNLTSVKEKRKSLNPFESSDEEVELNKKIKPPRPPPPKKTSTNPFGSDTEDDDDDSRDSANVGNITPKRTPVPTPRSYKHTSQNATPEPTPRATRQIYGTLVKTPGEHYASSTSLNFSGSSSKGGADYFSRDSEIRESGRSVASSGSSGTQKQRKLKKAPAPPPPSSSSSKVSKELFVSNDSDSKKSSPTSSRSTTPIPRKKRPAPAPPTVLNKLETEFSDEQSVHGSSPSASPGEAENSPQTKPDENCLEKLSDEEKVILENKSLDKDLKESPLVNEAVEVSEVSEGNNEIKRRLIALDSSLLEDADANHDVNIKEEENVVYRRTIAPLALDDLSTSPSATDHESHDRQLEKLKDNKEAKNRNRQSQISLPSEESDPLYNKSIHGKWKRRKGPAPALPVPPKKVLQMLPLQEIRHELEIIEVQQQGLEKQGVMLEKMIRERCEGPPGEDATDSNKSPSTNSKEVEDLILQLFELVNEKNELFRRQAELMYLRRQHRLEQEQADLEYEIRVLMAQPERNKTDSDKAREEALIARLVEVVQLRNEVVECLEMDRLREAEEDMSIKQRLEMHTAKRDEELSKQTPTKLSKKEKKKQKELKKLGKSKKLDADKDADETELTEKQKNKKKKKKFLF